MNRLLTGLCLLTMLGPFSGGCASGGAAGGDADVSTPADVAPPADGATGGDAADVDVFVPDVSTAPECLEGEAWSPGTPLFVERTSERGLDGVEGEYLSALDYDGDGWTDLLVRVGGGPDDFAPGGERSKHLLRNNGDGTFADMTQASGIFASRLNPDPLFGAEAKVVVAGDVNNDGHVDVYIGRSRLDPWSGEGETSELMLNNGDGTFSLGPSESDARFVSKPSNPASVVFVDYDRDGFLDLWIVHNEQSGPTGIQDRLLRGDGSGSFVDVTSFVGLSTKGWSIESLNLAEANSWGWGAAACDLNDDGLPELLAASYGRMANHLWRAEKTDGVVGFHNASISSGYAFDDRTDWTTNLSAQCYCEDHPDEEDCDLCPSPADPSTCQGLANAFGSNYRWDHATGREPFSLGGVTGTTLCVDLNNDGLLDLMNYEIVHGDVGESADPTEVLVNTGETPLRFTRPGPEVTGIVREETSAFWDHGDMTGAVLDLDNDGWQDVYIGSAEYAGTRGWLYRQNGPLAFEAVSETDGFLHWRAHGVAVGDFDRDGDVDMVVGHSHHRCEGFWDTECAPTRQIRLFDNVFGAKNNSLKVRLEGGSGTNGSAIGARVTLTTAAGTQTRVVDGGHGRFGLQGDPTLHFGMGADCEGELEIVWPNADRSTQSFSAIANTHVFVSQGEAAVTTP